MIDIIYYWLFIPLPSISQFTYADVTTPTLGLEVLTFFFKSWDETDRIFPEN